MTLKIDLKVKTNIAERWPSLSWTTFLYSAYQRRYSGASIKMGHGVYRLYSRRGYVDCTTMRSGECSFKAEWYDGAYVFKVKWSGDTVVFRVSNISSNIERYTTLEKLSCTFTRAGEMRAPEIFVKNDWTDQILNRLNR